MKTNSLRCEKCGSRNTVIISKKEAAEACKDPTIMCSKSGTIDLKIIVDILKLIVEIFSSLLSVFKDSIKNNNQKIILCKDCGYLKDF